MTKRIDSATRRLGREHGLGVDGERHLLHVAWTIHPKLHAHLSLDLHTIACVPEAPAVQPGSISVVRRALRPVGEARGASGLKTQS